MNIQNNTQNTNFASQISINGTPLSATGGLLYISGNQNMQASGTQYRPNFPITVSQFISTGLFGGISLFNTTDEVNSEFGRVGWTGNVFQISTHTGANNSNLRGIKLSASNGLSNLTIQRTAVGASPYFDFSAAIGGANGDAIRFSGSTPSTAAVGKVSYLTIATEYNSSADASGVDFSIKRKEITLGTGQNYFTEFTLNGLQKFAVTNSGSIIATGGLVLNTKFVSVNPFQVFNTDYCIVGVGLSGITGTLPNATGNAGRMFKLKNKGSAFFNIDASAGGKIFSTGAILNLTLNTGDSYEMISDGTTWLTV